MNEYLVFINGVLAAPGLFEGKTANAAIGGKFLQLTTKEESFRSELEHAGGKIRSIDVMEVRASKMVKRYRYEPPKDKSGSDDNFIRVPANEDTGEPTRFRFRCMGVANAF